MNLNANDMICAVIKDPKNPEGAYMILKPGAGLMAGRLVPMEAHEALQLMLQLAGDLAGHLRPMVQSAKPGDAPPRSLIHNP